MMAPIFRAFSCSRSFSKISITATTAAHDTGLPPMVLLISPGPSTPITSPRAATADAGIPLPMPLPNATKSGVSPSHSMANILPVRPNDDCTSSKANSSPFDRIQASSFGNHPSGANTNPAEPWYASTITPAILPEELALTASSMNSRHIIPQVSGFDLNGHR